MKKYLGICLAVVLVGFATGCGGSSKTLKCTKEENSSVYEMKQSMNINFSKGNITKMEINQDVKVADAYSSYMSELETSLKSAFSSYEEIKGFTVKTNTKDNTINLSVVADFSSMDEDAKKDLDIVDTKASFDDAKKAFEAQGYKCN